MGQVRTDPIQQARTLMSFSSYVDKGPLVLPCYGRYHQQSGGRGDPNRPLS